MKMQLEETQLELKITLTQNELNHINTEIKRLQNCDDEDDLDDCECMQATCYDCYGHKVFKEFYKFIRERATNVPQPIYAKKGVPRKKTF